ncbi:uncharacterized protein C8Q71DRAFT_891021 [Rhodofomes roseus]|uniref:Uncharacterized protein n=1 Tax=Rhodofomes roseus TaxID=34475 RepID=A0ABQ8JYK7_9APHY|nr:uncharacterized protein C8Q71DRAFT_891021 [Rhodofomes roseus]KAH9829312.1 hypothetical protein C8Q71DRAFT_891021 [Rhodofomes roseus]
MVNLIGRASERRITDQAVILEGGLQRKPEQARQRDLRVENRDAFVESLLRHAAAGRLHSQDTILTPEGKAPRSALDASRFHARGRPRAKMQMENLTALLALPEFLKEPIPRELEPLPVPVPPERKDSLGKSVRSSSMSAPPLASSSPTTGSPTTVSKMSRASRMQRVSSMYVAEYDETLHMLPGATLEAEVLPAAQIPGKTSDRYECLILKCGLSTSPFLRLPTRVTPGKKEVRPAGQHLHVQLSVSGGPANGNGPSTSVHSTLMYAPRLSAMRATGYICALCSLLLVHVSQAQDYPGSSSEHWAELKLHENVKKHSTQGIWPMEGHALSAMSAYNLYATPFRCSVREGQKEGRRWATYQWLPCSCVD